MAMEEMVLTMVPLGIRDVREMSAQFGGQRQDHLVDEGYHYWLIRQSQEQFAVAELP